MYYIQAVTSGDADHGAYPKLIWNLKPPFAQVYIIYPPHRLLSYGPLTARSSRYLCSQVCRGPSGRSQIHVIALRSPYAQSQVVYHDTSSNTPRSSIHRTSTL